MYRKRPIDNPGSVIATDFDNCLNRPIDPVAIVAKQQQFNDELKQERLAQITREQIAIRKCTNEKCPADQCFCNCQGHSSLDTPSELNLLQRIPSLFGTPLVPQAEG